jgi:hypothetical protein
MTTFQIREIETIIDIAWEGFTVSIWATDEYDCSGKRVWYYREKALNFGRTTSRSEAVAIGKLRLEADILETNESYAPHSEDFLRSIKDPFVGPVSRTLLIAAAGREVRIRMETDDYQSDWRLTSAPFRNRRVKSRRQVISLAKRHLLKEIVLLAARSFEHPEDDLPF